MNPISPHADERSRSIAARLLVLGDLLRAQSRGRAHDNELERCLGLSGGFGFLVGVLADFGVPSASAWRVPSVLAERLGHLEPTLIAADPAGLRSAMDTRPKPHRFPVVLCKWITRAARQLATEYDGRAELMWSDHPSAADLRSRFAAFDGIGQKKSAMAVELLEGLGIALGDMTGSDVAYDVHVRRVFLRSGLADTDSPQAIVMGARILVPSRPGSLDLPAWHIGRSWCRPVRPECESCPIQSACPCLLKAARSVRSV